MSAAAPAGRRITSQARFETATLLCNGEQLLVAIILPALALLGLLWSPYPDLGPGRRVDIVAPGVLALAVVSTAFTGQAISTGFDRRYGVLRFLGVSPLGRSGLLLAKVAATLAVLSVQIVVLGSLAAALGWRPALGGLLPAALSLVVGAAAFVALALLLAGTLRAEAVLAVANLVWVLLLGLGLLFPIGSLPQAAQPLARALPSGALGEAMRTALLHGAWPVTQWLVLLAWCGLSAALASRFFRWAA